jgi:hypothetical protein
LLSALVYATASHQLTCSTGQRLPQDEKCASAALVGVGDPVAVHVLVEMVEEAIAVCVRREGGQARSELLGVLQPVPVGVDGERDAGQRAQETRQGDDDSESHARSSSTARGAAKKRSNTLARPATLSPCSNRVIPHLPNP